MAIINVYKCPVCGETYNNRKIYMHLWNKHQIKYKEYVAEHGELEIVGTEEVADAKAPQRKEKTIKTETVQKQIEKIETKPEEQTIKQNSETNKKTIEDNIDISQISRLNSAENMGLRSWVSDEGENIVITEWC